MTTKTKKDILTLASFIFSKRNSAHRYTYIQQIPPSLGLRQLWHNELEIKVIQYRKASLPLFTIKKKSFDKQIIFRPNHEVTPLAVRNGKPAKNLEKLVMLPIQLQLSINLHNKPVSLVQQILYTAIFG